LTPPVATAAGGGRTSSTGSSPTPEAPVLRTATSLGSTPTLATAAAGGTAPVSAATPVPATSPVSGSSLAFTGAYLGTEGGVAALLLGAGGGLVALSRRRRRFASR
jgi:hypothetical protein